MSSFHLFQNKSIKQQHLQMILVTKLNFQEHLKNVLNKVNKTTGPLQKLQNILPRGPLLTIYKWFIRPHLDYGNVIYDQRYNSSFHQKLESMQYIAALSITGAIRGSSREKLCQELGLESLQQRRWFKKLCYFFKITKSQFPKYLFDKIPTTRTACRTKSDQIRKKLQMWSHLLKKSLMGNLIFRSPHCLPLAKASTNIKIIKHLGKCKLSKCISRSKVNSN